MLPSHGGEGIPRVVLEAAAAGRPAIVSDVSGCRHAVIDGETGFVCRAKSDESLFQACEKFLELSSEERLRMGRAARELAQAQFSEKQVISAYLNCLKKV